MKHLPSHFFNSVAAYEFSEYFCTLPANFDIADLFNPVSWTHHVHKLNEGDIIRIRSIDGRSDFCVVVDTVTPGGVNVTPWPRINGVSALPDLDTLAAEKRLTVVPIANDGEPVVRVQHLPATGWRVMGINGEVSRNHRSEAEARNKMEEYLNLAGLKMPVREEKAIEGEVEPPVAEAPKAPARKAPAKEKA